MKLFDQIPIELVYFLTVAFALFSSGIGYRFGLWLHKRNPDLKKDSSTGALVGALLGLLAFLLTFTTSYALEQFQKRRALVVADANAIGTAYLRADYLEEAGRNETKELLVEYVDLRLSSDDPADLGDILVRSEAIQTRLWEIAVEEGQSQPSSQIIALYGEAINDLIDVHGSRLAVIIGSRLPALMWFMLYGIVFVSFLLVGIASSAEGKRNYFTLILFALGFASVLMLITDLDRSQEGLLQVSQNALENLQRQMGNFGN